VWRVQGSAIGEARYGGAKPSEVAYSVTKDPAPPAAVENIEETPATQAIVAPEPAVPAPPVSRRPIVGGNWKCNPEKLEALDGLVDNINACDTSKCDVYVCPSSLHIGMLYKKFTNGAKVCPQNCNFKGCGAFTGEMAADQMVGMGLEWCLIGHSERRGEFGLPTPAESNELLATKLKYMLDQGLNAVLAIGEPLPVRDKGLDAVLDYRACSSSSRARSCSTRRAWCSPMSRCGRSAQA
jgi:hypothetical protein